MDSGTLKVDEVYNLDNEAGKRMAAEAVAASNEIRGKMSPRGVLRLPPLLDQRRLEHGITDAAFDEQPAFDRIYVYQIHQFNAETFGDTSIIMPDTVKERQLRTAPRGIIVAAGLTALDHLRSHGIDLGHIITFLRLSPWHKRYDIIRGKEQYLLMLRAGDIVSSEDTAERLRKGEIFVKWDKEAAQHVYIDRQSGEQLTPSLPYMSEEF